MATRTNRDTSSVALFPVMDGLMVPDDAVACCAVILFFRCRIFRRSCGPSSCSRIDEQTLRGYDTNNNRYFMEVNLPKMTPSGKMVIT